MGTRRTAWHFCFSRLLRKRGPSWIEVRDEVSLADERPRVDYLLLRKTAAVAAEDRGKTLLGLWRHLGLWTIIEFKSIGRPYRRGNLDRLWAYVHLYYAYGTEERACLLATRSDLRAVLVVPARSPALSSDVAAMGLGWKNLGGGYWELTGGLFPLYVVDLVVVAEHEDDDLVRWFSDAKARTQETRRFWAEQLGTMEAGMSVQELEGYDEVIQKLLDGLPPEQRLAGLAPEQRLAGLAPEQRLAGLAPEQRLSGLAPEQAILALPDEVLRGFSEEYLATLSKTTRAAIHKRIGR